MKIIMFYDPYTKKATVNNSLNQGVRKEIAKAEPNTIVNAFVICHSNHHVRIVHDLEQKKVFYWVDMKVKSIDHGVLESVVFDTEINKFD